MKNFKTLLLIAIVTLGLNTVQAQTKVAHINTDLLLSLMPETKVLNADLEKLSKTYENELKAESDKFTAKLKKYEAEVNSQTDEVNQQRGAEVEQDRQNLYQASQVAREEIAKKRDEQLKPILDKAKKAIEDVAKEQGFVYVLDASSLIVANGTDLLPAVKAKLGIK
ncbi:OmpH family outer membrane protein [Lutibacter maritimus]|jgi:outer membrane protein|uniref:Periplasmic chaperone for outer membrane proteins Skp n=1 Tax=Lutibacter maritimus TaxID=593133 RepID=A0A1I6Q7D0_9FLAO|nr:OmpH family outer membrane protein [Lutibacter maritimus]SFS48332.1 periplasmic chaperone for outer membrane proteins Skp [Lutibacter maritimus]